MLELIFFDIGRARDRIYDSTLTRMKDEVLVRNLQGFCAHVTSFYACRAMVESHFSAMKNGIMSVVAYSSILMIRELEYERGLEKHERFITQH